MVSNFINTFRKNKYLYNGQYGHSSTLYAYFNTSLLFSGKKKKKKKEEHPLLVELRS